MHGEDESLGGGGPRGLREQAGEDLGRRDILRVCGGGLAGRAAQPLRRVVQGLQQGLPQGSEEAGHGDGVLLVRSHWHGPCEGR